MLVAEPEDIPVLSRGNDVPFTNFKTQGNWKFEKGEEVVLLPRPGESGWKRYASYLWLEDAYQDFVCSFEYKHGKAGNSGFYFRVKDRKDPVKTGIEIQILDSYGKKGALSHHDCGGVVFTRPASKNMAKPANQWNQMTVKCVKNHLQVWLNGEMIQDMNLNQTLLKDRPLRGSIGFQDHGLPLKLRNIRIKKL